MVPKLSWIKVPLCLLDIFHGIARLQGEGGEGVCARSKRGCEELENIVPSSFTLFLQRQGELSSW